MPRPRPTLDSIPRSQGGTGAGNCSTPQDGWSQSGKLFCQNTPPTFVPGQPQVLAGAAVLLQKQFPDRDVYTVQFDVNTALLAPGQSAQITQADIVWSLMGNSIRRRVNVISGMSISGLAEAVQVRAYDVSPVGSEFGLPGFAYTVSINCSRGIRSAQSQQPYWIPQNFADSSGGGGAWRLAGGGSTTIELFPNLSPSGTPIAGPPQYIGATSVHVTVGSQDGSPIPDNAAQVIQDNIGVPYDPRVELWVPLMAGCTRLTLKNNSVATNYTFGVVLGIDG